MILYKKSVYFIISVNALHAFKNLHIILQNFSEVLVTVSIKLGIMVWKFHLSLKIFRLSSIDLGQWWSSEDHKQGRSVLIRTYARAYS